MIPAFPTFQRLIDELRKLAVNDGDRKLVAIFEEHRAALTKHFNNSLYENRGEYFEKQCPKAPGGLEWFGPMFHKGFRQYDVLPSGHLDMEVWKLISTDSEMFWTAAHNVVEMRK